MTLAPHVTRPEPDAEQGVGRGPLVVWRTWLLQPEQISGIPILTGLYGFRWPGPEMDAKCTLQDPAIGDHRPGRRRIDRHHRVIPDPHCSCGIYAGLDELTRLRSPRPPRRVPFVTGFVALSGRVLVDGEMLRAQHATIIGPLSLALGRPPFWHSLAPVVTASLPARVVAYRGTYRTLWTKRDVGEAGPMWLQSQARALSLRYRVAVEVAGSR